MNFYDLVLIFSILLCSLTAGIVFAFATVVMPGLAKLDDKAFIRGFQVIDGVIQNGQPIFGLVWIGSALSIILTAGLATLQLDGLERLVLVASALVYLLGVQLPTFRINIPLNNTLQALDVDNIDEGELASARLNFEERWVRWNMIRTVLATLVSLVLILILRVP